MRSTRKLRPNDELRAKTLTVLFSPVDISFLVLFRIVVGCSLLWVMVGFFQHELVSSLAIRPFHFTYHGFAWVKPLPEVAMQIHGGLLILVAVFLALGFLYRLSAVISFFGFTYVFLLDKTEYFNHYYLICLFLLLLVFLPANRCCSLDALLRPKIRMNVVPAWTLWLARFQVGLPYVFGGIAKLNADWLRGEPMRIWLSKGPLPYLFGPVIKEPWMALLFSWGGVILDLAIVPLLLWRRTRPVAFSLAVLFHLLNAIMFEIDVFPWMMIGATLVFFPPDWPRRLFSRGTNSPATQRDESRPVFRREAYVGVLLVLYVGFHVLVPFRHCFIPGNASWTEEGHRFAWRMMLRTKVNAVQFVVTDRMTGQSELAQPIRWLTPRQYNKMGRDPEMLREFAHFVRQRYRERRNRDVEVRVVVLSSLNGRQPQQLVEPETDLSREPRRWWHQAWILPLTQPFREQPWQVPVRRWPQHIPVRWPTAIQPGVRDD